jgi:hypothetical protein
VEGIKKQYSRAFAKAYRDAGYEIMTTENYLPFIGG